MKKSISIIACAALLFCGCQNEAPVAENPSLEVTEDIIAVPFGGVDSYEVTVTTNNDWEAKVSAEAEWLTVSPASGKSGKSALAISVSENTSHDSRMGGVTLRAGKLRKQISIAQAPAPNNDLITLSVPDVRFDHKAASSVVAVTSNVDWKASCTADWVTVAPASGKASASAANVSIAVAANTGKTNREAVVVFSGGDAKDVEFSIFQEAFESIVTSASSVSFKYDGTSTDNVVNVEANVAWTATASDSWIKVSPASGAKGATVSMTITADPNEADTERKGSVTLTGGSAVETIAVTQGGHSLTVKTIATFKVDDAAYTEAHNPDWSTAGANAYSNGTGKGIALPEEAGSKGYMTWIHSGSFETTDSKKLTFITAAEGHYAVKPAFTDDAFEFHLPVDSAPAGALFRVKLGCRAVASAPMYWSLKFSTDGGTTWTAMDTGFKEAAKNGKEANCAITTANETFNNEGVSVLPAAITNGEIIFRLECVDGTWQVQKKTVSTPTSGSTVRITPVTLKGVTYSGPVFTIEY